MKKKAKKWLEIILVIALFLVYLIAGTVYEMLYSKNICNCKMSIATTKDGNFYMLKNDTFQSEVLKFDADGIISATYTDQVKNLVSQTKSSFSGIMAVYGNDLYFLKEYIDSETNCRIRYDLLKLYEEDGKLQVTTIYELSGESLPEIWSINVEDSKIYLSSVCNDYKTVQIDKFDIMDDDKLFLRSSQKYLNSEKEAIAKSMYLNGYAVMISNTNKIYIANNESEKIIFPEVENNQGLITFSTVKNNELVFGDIINHKIYTYNILTNKLTSQNMQDVIHTNKYNDEGLLYVNIGDAKSVAVATSSTYDELEVIFWDKTSFQTIPKLKMPFVIALSSYIKTATDLYLLTILIIAILKTASYFMNRKKQIVFKFIKIVILFMGSTLAIICTIENSKSYSQNYRMKLMTARELGHYIKNKISINDIEELNSTLHNKSESYKKILENLLSKKEKAENQSWEGLCYYNHLMLVSKEKDTVKLLIGPSKYDEFLMPVENIYSAKDCQIFYNALNSGKEEEGTTSNYSGSWVTYALPIADSKGKTIAILVTYVGLNDLSFETEYYAAAFILISIILILVFSILIYYFFKKVLRPLTELKEAFKKVGKGDYSVRLVSTFNDEFADINFAFNKMCEEISNSVYNLKKIKNNYDKFMPDSIFKVFDETNIDKINVGDYKKEEYIFVVQNISNFKMTSAKNIEISQTMQIISELFRIVDKCAERNNGISVVNGLGVESLRVLFDKHNSSNAVDYSLNVIGNLEKNISKFGQMDITTIIHRGENIFGILGDEETAHSWVCSEDDEDIIEYIFKLRDSGLKVVVTDKVIASIENKYNTRHLGFMLSKDKTQKHKMYEVLESCTTEQNSKKALTKIDFEKGIELFYNNNFYQARANFSEVLQQNPEDKIAKWYLLICDKCYKNTDFKTSYELLGDII